ncbi:transporter; sodium/bile acid transporter family protein [Acinetobacter baumannii]|nr:transporter; sodium/bile acid transporter family protein [Acinetobacter baumannii]
MLTPTIFYLLASQWLKIDAASMFISILQVVLLPIVIGLILRTWLKRQVESYIQVMPLVSVIAIVAIVAAIIGGSKAAILQSGLLILAVVILHNGLGYLLGFAAARFFKLPYVDSKARNAKLRLRRGACSSAFCGFPDYCRTKCYFQPLA